MQTSRGRARDGGELQGLLARPFFPQTPRKWTRLLQVHDLHRNRVTSTRRTCDLDVGELRQNRWQRPRSQMTELDRNLRERGRPNHGPDMSALRQRMVWRFCTNRGH